MSFSAKSQSKNTIKIPPHNAEAEQTVLGSVLIDKNAIHKVADMLIGEDFYVPAHETIYNAIIELYEKRQPIDVMTVGNLLKEKKRLPEVGGSAYLADLTNQVTTASHVDHYAQIVKEKKISRDLIRASAEISEGAFDQSDDFEQMLDNVEQKILGISQKSLPKNFVHIGQELAGAIDRISKLHDNQGAMRGVPTGFKDLDHYLSGLQKSDLVILGARPSVGKTSFAMDIAKNAAMQGFKVGVFSLEMSREQVIDRLISSESGVPLWKLRTGRITDDTDFQMIQASLDKLSNAPIFIDDTPSPSIMQIRAMARRLQVEHGLDMLVIDYLQLIMPRRTQSDNMVQQVTEISRGLKAIARELNIPVLALSQLSRAVDQRDNKTPKLHDLRESGSIEQDADVVMFIYREKDPTTIQPGEESITQIIIAKHRNGPLGVVDLHFDADKTSFRSIDNRHAPTGFSNDLASLN